MGVWGVFCQFRVDMREAGDLLRRLDAFFILAAGRGRSFAQRNSAASVAQCSMVTRAALSTHFRLPFCRRYWNSKRQFLMSCWGVGKLVSLQILILSFAGSSPAAPSINSSMISIA